MPLSTFLDRFLGGTGPDFREYECDDCGHRHESAKEPERAKCPECLSADVTVVDAVDRS